MRRILLFLLMAAQFPNLVPAADSSAPAKTHFVLELWQGDIPGAKQSETYQETIILRDEDPAKPRISKVTRPGLEVLLPSAPNDPTAAVVICPGGGYGVLAYDHEGTQVARWFNERGVAAIILKYRLPSDLIMQDKTVGPLQDAQEALRTVRRHAADWGINPAQIGIMGFSAGGHLAGSATTRHAERVYEPSDATSARPDFSILCYGVLSMQPDITHRGSFENLLGQTPDQATIDRSSNELRVDATTPPTFLVHAQNDKAVPVENSLRFYAAMTRLGIPGELHIHENGGHGFGLGVNPDSPKHWPDELQAWMTRNGWMRGPATPPAATPAAAR